MYNSQPRENNSSTEREDENKRKHASRKKRKSTNESTRKSKAQKMYELFDAPEPDHRLSSSSSSDEDDSVSFTLEEDLYLSEEDDPPGRNVMVFHAAPDDLNSSNVEEYCPVNNFRNNERYDPADNYKLPNNNSSSIMEDAQPLIQEPQENEAEGWEIQSQEMYPKLDNSENWKIPRLGDLQLYDPQQNWIVPIREENSKVQIQGEMTELKNHGSSHKIQNQHENSNMRKGEESYRTSNPERRSSETYTERKSEISTQREHSSETIIRNSRPNDDHSKVINPEPNYGIQYQREHSGVTNPVGSLNLQSQQQLSRGSILLEYLNRQNQKHSKVQTPETNKEIPSRIENSTNQNRGDHSKSKNNEESYNARETHHKRQNKDELPYVLNAKMNRGESSGIRNETETKRVESRSVNMDVKGGVRSNVPTAETNKNTYNAREDSQMQNKNETSKTQNSKVLIPEVYRKAHIRKEHPTAQTQDTNRIQQYDHYRVYPETWQKTPHRVKHKFLPIPEYWRTQTKVEHLKGLNAETKQKTSEEVKNEILPIPETSRKAQNQVQSLKVPNLETEEKTPKTTTPKTHNQDKHKMMPIPQTSLRKLIQIDFLNVPNSETEPKASNQVKQKTMAIPETKKKTKEEYLKVPNSEAKQKMSNQVQPKKLPIPETGWKTQSQADFLKVPNSLTRHKTSEQVKPKTLSIPETSWKTPTQVDFLKTPNSESKQKTSSQVKHKILATPEANRKLETQVGHLRVPQPEAHLGNRHEKINKQAKNHTASSKGQNPQAHQKSQSKVELTKVQNPYTNSNCTTQNQVEHLKVKNSNEENWRIQNCGPSDTIKNLNERYKIPRLAGGRKVQNNAEHLDGEDSKANWTTPNRVDHSKVPNPEASWALPIDETSTQTKKPRDRSRVPNLEASHSKIQNPETSLSIHNQTVNLENQRQERNLGVQMQEKHSILENPHNSRVENFRDYPQDNSQDQNPNNNDQYVDLHKKSVRWREELVQTLGGTSSPQYPDNSAVQEHGENEQSVDLYNNSVQNTVEQDRISIPENLVGKESLSDQEETLEEVSVNVPLSTEQPVEYYDEITKPLSDVKIQLRSVSQVSQLETPEIRKVIFNVIKYIKSLLNFYPYNQNRSAWKTNFWNYFFGLIPIDPNDLAFIRDDIRREVRQKRKKHSKRTEEILPVE